MGLGALLFYFKEYSQPYTDFIFWGGLDNRESHVMIKVDRGDTQSPQNILRSLKDGFKNQIPV